MIDHTTTSLKMFTNMKINSPASNRPSPSLMHQEIADKVIHLSSTGVLPPIVSASPVEGVKSNSENDGSPSNSSGSTGLMERPAARCRFTRHSQVPEAELD